MFSFGKKQKGRKTQLTNLKLDQGYTPAQAPIITDFAEIEALNPTSNPEILARIQQLKHLKNVNGSSPGFVDSHNQVYCIRRTDLDRSEALALHQIINIVREETGREPAIRETTRSVFESHITQTRESLQEQTQESSQQVNEILHDSIDKKATDVHLEIKNNITHVYQRIYGQMIAAQTFNKTQGIKIIAAIWNIYVKQAFSDGDVAKNGRFVFEHNQRRWLCRVSYGYSKVTAQYSMALRLRDMHHIPELATLGYHDSQLNAIKQASANKGMTLIIGAVNSGKSTTQTAIMKNRPQLEKNLEISDQIEVELNNFVQLQLPIEGTQALIEENRELLRRMSTRHDVDFIAINEIRDLETAAMAASMMLQGTAGIASIHGSGWVDAINRLLSSTDLNVSKDILFSESFLSMVITQTLVGILCNACKLQTHSDPFWDDYYRQGFGKAVARQLRFHNPDGCKTCRQSGITGLTLIAEIIPVNETSRLLLMNTTQPQAMRDWQKQHAVLNLHQHAYTKIIRGHIDPCMAQRKIGEFSNTNLYDDWLH